MPKSFATWATGRPEVWTSRTARSRSSSGYLRGAGIGPVFSHLPRRSRLASGPLQNPLQLRRNGPTPAAATAIVTPPGRWAIADHAPTWSPKPWPRPKPRAAASLARFCTPTTQPAHQQGIRRCLPQGRCPTVQEHRRRRQLGGQRSRRVLQRRGHTRDTPAPQRLIQQREARLDAFGRLHRYNTRHRHSRLGHRSPIACETAMRTINYARTNRITHVRNPGSRPRFAAPSLECEANDRRFSLAGDQARSGRRRAKQPCRASDRGPTAGQTPSAGGHRPQPPCFPPVAAPNAPTPPRSSGQACVTDPPRRGPATEALRRRNVPADLTSPSGHARGGGLTAVQTVNSTASIQSERFFVPPKIQLPGSLQCLPIQPAWCR